jgi:hypothetical protein
MTQRSRRVLETIRLYRMYRQEWAPHPMWVPSRRSWSLQRAWWQAGEDKR